MGQSYHRHFNSFLLGDKDHLSCKYNTQAAGILAHCGDVIISAMASQITSLTIVCSNVYSGADQRKHQSSASLAFVRGIHRWPVNSQRKGSVTRKMFPFDDVTMNARSQGISSYNINLILSEDYTLLIFFIFPKYPIFFSGLCGADRCYYCRHRGRPPTGIYHWSVCVCHWIS